MKKFLQTWLITTLSVLVAVYIVPGLRFTDHTLVTPFVTALILGILTAVIRPLLMLLALPLLIVTLGLFTFVINALLLYLVGILLSAHFQVDGFGSAFLGALIISVVSTILNILTGNTKGKIRVERRVRNRGGGKGNGGSGPVIDV